MDSCSYFEYPSNLHKEGGDGGGVDIFELIAMVGMGEGGV